jgi:hypothetical protein
VLGIGQSVRVDDLLRQIDEVAVLLSLPLGDGDRADGWTEQSQAAVLEGVARLKSELASGRFSDEADYASRHLVRVLDHWGISTGRIYDRLNTLQLGLIDGRP